MDDDRVILEFSGECYHSWVLVDMEDTHFRCTKCDAVCEMIKEGKE